MKQRLISTVLISLLAICAYSQTKIRDVFASASDSIFPLLTTNNRLDCIDFIENSMKARVKNRLDGTSELKELTSNYLLMQITNRSTIEMRLLSDSLFCLIETFKGPALDSHICFYDTQWQRVELDFPIPSVSDFWKPVPENLQQEASFIQRSLQDLFLLHISASKDNTNLTLTLQTSELPSEEKEIAQKYVQPLILRWDGKRFVR